MSDHPFATARAAKPAASAWSLTPRLPVARRVRLQRDPRGGHHRGTRRCILPRVPPRSAPWNQRAICSTLVPCRRTPCRSSNRAPVASSSSSHRHGSIARTNETLFAYAHFLGEPPSTCSMRSSTPCWPRTRSSWRGAPSTPDVVRAAATGQRSRSESADSERRADAQPSAADGSQSHRRPRAPDGRAGRQATCSGCSSSNARWSRC